MISLDNGDKIQGDAAAATVVDFIISGLDANAIKQLADGQLPSSINDLFTADSADVVTSVILVNTDSSARAVNLYVTPSGGTARRIIPKNMSLGIGYCLITDGNKIGVYDATGSLLSVSAVITHDLGGASHDADTLSNLNTKISDATLVDTDDIILKSLLTTKGDLIATTGSSTPVRLGAGSDDEVLTADSAQASGVKWAAAAAGVTIVRKTANQVVRNSETLVNDNQLLFAVGANEIWEFELFLTLEGDNTAGDFKFNIVVPSGASGEFINQLEADGAGDKVPTAIGSNLVVDVTQVNKSMLVIRGIIVVSSTAGNVQLQWAQNSAADNDYTIYENSCIIAHQLD